MMVAGDAVGNGLPLADRVYLQMKELILTGELPGGSLVSEGEIGDRFATSRTPVREAFLRLQADDLLVLHPKRGAVVVAAPATEVDDVLDVREALETSAVRRLVVRADRGALLAPARGAIEAQVPLAAAGDLAAFSLVDEQFHRAIVTAAGNPLATRFYTSLGDRQRRMMLGSLRRRLDHLEVLVGEHRELLAAIERADTAGFAAALRSHLDVTHRLLTRR